MGASVLSVITCIFSGLARTEEREVARLRRELERYYHVNIQSHSY